ncbi:MAG: hypothetical protein HeimC2_11430 [Candidatus Heimdallarchaeota archaeon LC_2]|nr:MAG: hypothetical protein HeimC2_11430 [Candidatus Heimdallarchaeota archaeon LC_2]
MSKPKNMLPIIKETYVIEVTNRPNIGEVFSSPTTFSFNFPNKDTTLKAYTHILGGLGTDDMILRFIVGDINRDLSYLQIEVVLGLILTYFLLIIILFFSRSSIINWINEFRKDRAIRNYL